MNIELLRQGVNQALDSQVSQYCANIAVSPHEASQSTLTDSSRKSYLARIALCEFSLNRSGGTIPRDERRARAAFSSSSIELAASPESIESFDFALDDRMTETTQS